jgi:hypothetical protein
MPIKVSGEKSVLSTNSGGIIKHPYTKTVILHPCTKINSKLIKTKYKKFPKKIEKGCELWLGKDFLGHKNPN